MSDADIALRVENISKSYGAVEALTDVTFDLERNKILGLVGDNGAGKSTLLKILNGFLQPDDGRILLDGTEVVFDSPQAAADAGIAMTYQDMALVDGATVWDNFFMGREIISGFGPVKTLNTGEMIAHVEDTLAEYDVEQLHPNDRVEDLSGGEKQILSISRSIDSNPDVLMLDEPLTELSRSDRRSVIEFIRNLREQSETSIILVSHDLKIVRELVDKIMILNDGQDSLTGPPTEFSTDEIVEHMV